jgi:hypothetical protein
MALRDQLLDVLGRERARRRSGQHRLAAFHCHPRRADIEHIDARQHQAQLHTMVEAQLRTRAATDSTSLVTEIASRHPPLNSTGVPVGDGLRPIDAQF